MNSKKITLMIQARTGSKRLPRKVLSKIENKPMIWHIINRAKQVRGIDQIVILTTKRQEDDILVKIAKDSDIISFRGHTYDVLTRYYECAKSLNSEIIIRITGDCPLIDPALISKLLKFYSTNKYDYVTNIEPPTFPDGLDIEIFSFKVLKKINQLSRMKSEREHVTPYIRKNKNRFKIFNLKNNVDLSKLRWTVDEKSDLLFVRKIYKKMRPKIVFGFEDVLKILRRNPEINEINKGITRNEGYVKSLKNDRKIK